MKKILKSFLMSLLVSYSILGVVSCNSVSFSPGPEPIATVDISFATINKMTLDDSAFLMTIAQSDVTGASDNLPENFWVNDVATLNCRYNDIFVDQVGSVYDFNGETEISVIQNKLQTMVLISVSITIWGDDDSQMWDLRDFSGSLA